MVLIDTHCHLAAPDFDTDREDVLRRAREQGVHTIISIGAGYGIESAHQTVALANTYEQVFASVGVHPNDAALAFDDTLLPNLVETPKVVALGETGLDFYRNNVPRDVQERWFIHHIEVAKAHRKPLIIHSREAGRACLDLLKQHEAYRVGGVFHCYGEDDLFAKELCEINFLISVPGTLTFKNAEKLRETVKKIPLSQIMLETDAPFLAPQPYRGKRCESSFMIETAKMLAHLKGVSLEEVTAITTHNACRLFGIALKSS